MNDELAANSLRDSNSDIPIDEGKIAAQRGAIASLTNSVATGRLVIPLLDIMAGRARDVVLNDGDRLMVPKISQEVTILGEVRRVPRPTSLIRPLVSRIISSRVVAIRTGLTRVMSIL